MVEFRDYQREIIVNGSEVLGRCGFLYLAMEVRTGKTLTSLGIAERLGLNSVLFITKKKAMSSIDSDFKMMQPSPIFLHVVNYESLHKIPNLSWDLVVCDEAHTLGAFPEWEQEPVWFRDITGESEGSPHGV
jgi:superfamily II DNA or RNA helicase